MIAASDIAAQLGGAYRSGTWWRCRCPVHNSQGATLALRDGDQGLIAVCHAGCPRPDIFVELRQRGLIADHIEGSRLAPVMRRNDGRAVVAWRTALARRIWETARDAWGTPVARYLAGRGITTPLPLSLRWAPSLRRLDGTHTPAMVARVDGLNGELLGVHRTWLDRDAAGRWHRRDRASLGPIAGGAVRLAPAAEMLMVAEGIETALAAMKATGLPAWAALSTSGMMALRLPPEVRRVVILADNDHNGAGQHAARVAAQRWLAEGRRVRIAVPQETASDFADLVAGDAEPHDVAG